MIDADSTRKSTFYRISLPPLAGLIALLIGAVCSSMARSSLLGFIAANGNASAQIWALDHLERQRPQPIPEIASALKCNNHRVWRKAAQIIKRAEAADIEPFLPEIFIAVQQNESAEVRSSILDNLSWLSGEQKEQVELVSRLLGHEHFLVQRQSAYYLHSISLHERFEIPGIVWSRLTDKNTDEETQKALLEVVVNCAPPNSQKNQRTRQVIDIMLKDRRATIRAAAIRATKHLGWRNFLSQSTVIELLQDDDIVKSATLGLLNGGACQSSEVIEEVKTLLENENLPDHLRESAELLLGSSPVGQELKKQ